MRQYSKIHLENFTIEELESFSENQLIKVSIEGLKSLLRIRKDENVQEEKATKFWKEEYPNLSVEEKVKYWTGGLFRSMRWQEESGFDPYIIYTENWLKETLKLEPDFISLLPKIYVIWGGMFDHEKVDRKIKKMLDKM